MAAAEGLVVAVVDVVSAELDCWLSQGRHAKVTTPINRTIAATPPRTTQARQIRRLVVQHAVWERTSAQTCVVAVRPE